MNAPAKIVEADLDNQQHQHDVLAMLQMYASDEMGNSAPLPAEVVERLIPGLREHPTTLIFLAYVEGRATGIAVCFRGFSTFYALPIVNIHDLAVAPGFRGQGIGSQLLDAVEGKARSLGCCKVTLEVQENNTRARRVYEFAGFAQAVYGTHTGGSLFYVKLLPADSRS
jgi:ribosomal protein S18 acetylase RimI-like enzyme